MHISSNANRFYCGVETSYGQTPVIGAQNRFPAVKLGARQKLDITDRKDKTGSRTFTGSPIGGRRRTDFDLLMYLSTWANMTAPPGFGPLVQAALGAAPLLFAGGTAGNSANASQIAFAAPHGLIVNQGVECHGEIRFVASVIDASTVLLNAPFSAVPSSGTALGATITYLPATELPSVSIFDYWSPAAAVQRILCGAVVDKFSILVNGDYHEFHFQGLAQDVLDSASFVAGEGQLSTFPAEPALGSFSPSAVPGNLGQLWMGTTAQRFLTITEASVILHNDLDLRTREFGSSVPLDICPGPRKVAMDVALFEQTDSATTDLYQAARQRSPITVMIQLGQAAGQLCGVLMKSVIPEVPEFDDRERCLQWRFQQSRAQGTIDDEIAVAFA